jgi:hypothetical protein
MPDEGASMKDSPPVREDEARRRAGAEHGSRDRVQDERMPEYQIEERKRESATVIEQAAGEGPRRSRRWGRPRNPRNQEGRRSWT